MAAVRGVSNFGGRVDQVFFPMAGEARPRKWVDRIY